METQTGKNVRVYVIEDDELVCDAVCLMLRDAGFAVSYANDADRALKEVAKAAPDVIVTDLQMPGSENADVVGELRRRLPNVPIIAVSGRPELQERARELGASIFLAKPIQGGVLTERIMALAQGADRRS